MINQLRIYEIFDHNKDAFHARFRDHAARIMDRYGFRILAMWETRSGERTEFCYLLAWRDEAEMTGSWERFLADPEWTDIKRITAEDHGSLVGDISNRVLLPTDYSQAIEGTQ